MAARPSLYAEPVLGASLLLSFKLAARTFLIVGATKTAAARAIAALEADAQVVVAAPYPLQSACEEIQWRASRGQLRYIELTLPKERSIEELLDQLSDISFVCVTDTLLSDDSHARRSFESAQCVYDACRRRRIPLNVTDIPSLCDYTFPSTQRFVSKTSECIPSPITFAPSSRAFASVQIAVTTNGQACRLGSRLRREIASKIDPTIGDAVANVSRLRTIAKEVQSGDKDKEDCAETAGAIAPLNTPVEQYSCSRTRDEDPSERVRRRMRWVNQISEYWPVKVLATLGEVELRKILSSLIKEESMNSSSLVASSSSPDGDPSWHNNQKSFVSPPSLRSEGKILLVGSGPGHPSLLTRAAYQVLTCPFPNAQSRILSDKLVPSEVLALIPKNIPVYIAKKYPGNSEDAQNELMEMAVEGAKRGETVLKQGDPFLYGRGGEEVLYFRSHGFEPIVIPGVSSALAGPAFAGMAVTQRGVAETLMICTGVGRKGKSVTFPPYERSRTLVVLMGVARLGALLEQLRGHKGGAYPGYLPIAIVERASSPDQRTISATLDSIQRALESSEVGDLRTPGMIVVGWVVLALEHSGNLDVLDDITKSESGEELETLDRARIARWLGGHAHVVKDGLSSEWKQFL